MKYEGIEKAVEEELGSYKRAINDIVTSLDEIENLVDLQYFQDTELKEILNGLNLD